MTNERHCKKCGEYESSARVSGACMEGAPHDFIPGNVCEHCSAGVYPGGVASLTLLACGGGAAGDVHLCPQAYEEHLKECPECRERDGKDRQHAYDLVALYGDADMSRAELVTMLTANEVDEALAESMAADLRPEDPRQHGRDELGKSATLDSIEAALTGTRCANCGVAKSLTREGEYCPKTNGNDTHNFSFPAPSPEAEQARMLTEALCELRLQEFTRSDWDGWAGANKPDGFEPQIAEIKVAGLPSSPVDSIQWSEDATLIVDACGITINFADTKEEGFAYAIHKPMSNFSLAVEVAKALRPEMKFNVLIALGFLRF